MILLHLVMSEQPEPHCKIKQKKRTSSICSTLLWKRSPPRPLLPVLNSDFRSSMGLIRWFWREFPTKKEKEKQFVTTNERCDLLYRNASNLKIEQHRITDGSNGSSHQAVPWTIHSPLIADPIHITGVYLSSREGEVEKCFHTLTQQDHYPDREIHVYAGDFNAHVAEELEAHITLQERFTIPPRVGDCHRRHIPSPPDAPAITNARMSSQQRGRLLL